MRAGTGYFLLYDSGTLVRAGTGYFHLYNPGTQVPAVALQCMMRYDVDHSIQVQIMFFYFQVLLSIVCFGFGKCIRARAIASLKAVLTFVPAVNLRQPAKCIFAQWKENDDCCHAALTAVEGGVQGITQPFQKCVSFSDSVEHPRAADDCWVSAWPGGARSVRTGG